MGLCRKLFVKSDDDFPKSSQSCLISAFIYKLPLELRQLLQAEKTELNFSNFLCRARELESIYKLFPESEISEPDPTLAENETLLKELEFVKTLNENQLKSQEMHLKSSENQFQSLSSIISSLNDYVKTPKLEANKPKNPKSFKKTKTKNSAGFFNGIECSRLRGFCAFEVLGQGCNRKRFCKYKHKNIPREICNI